MTIFRPLTKKELAVRIVRRIPEINPHYVLDVLSASEKIFFDERDVSFWIAYFEDCLYSMY